MKKLLLEDTELEYDIFQSSTKESLNCINSTNENIILIYGGIMADANISIVIFSDILGRFTYLLASTNNDNINTKCTSYDSDNKSKRSS